MVLKNINPTHSKENAHNNSIIITHKGQSVHACVYNNL